MPDFGSVDLLKPNDKEYSLDVMQTFSKNFTELQEHFDKVTKQISTPAQETAAAEPAPEDDFDFVRIASLEVVRPAPALRPCPPPDPLACWRSPPARRPWA